MHEPKTIAEHINVLARLTGAPVTFVDQVRALFVAKGISLQATAVPFLGAIEEAFRREERIRHTTGRARENLAKLNDNFRRVGKAYVEQASRLDGMRSRPGRATRRRATAVESTGRPTQVTIKGDHRTFVTRPVREEQPMVPGPEEIQ